MSSPPAPLPPKKLGLSAREMLLVGLAAMFVGELYWNSSGAAPTWPLRDAPDPQWFDWPFSPPVFGWALSIAADGLSRLVAFLGPRAAVLEAKLEPKLEAAEASLEGRVEAILHTRGLRRPAPTPAAIASEPVSPVMPAVAPGPMPAAAANPSPAAAQRGGAEAIKDGH